MTTRNLNGYIPIWTRLIVNRMPLSINIAITCFSDRIKGISANSLVAFNIMALNPINTSNITECNNPLANIGDVTNIKWDQKLINNLNKQASESLRAFRCASNDFGIKALQLQKYCSLNDLVKHISVNKTDNSFSYEKDKLDFYKIDSEKKTQYMFGFKTISKPRLCYFWERAEIKMCRGTYGDFHIIAMINEASVINVMEHMMGIYMKKIQRQIHTTPITIDDGVLVSIPKEMPAREKFLSRFFVLDVADNSTNIENNTCDNPMVVSRMSIELYQKLFNVSDAKKISDCHNFIVCTLFNGVSEKTKILQPSKETQSSFNLWLTPIVFVYVRDSAQN
uniref:DNA binding protein n=1 Tax=Adoxophyes orana granulovirus TaxID=170617 RepID=A0A0A7UYR9_GVAO|nr:DNA binding protein [Adoxophyes orana granulovirus]